MPDQSFGTYFIGGLIVFIAVVCGLILWLEEPLEHYRKRRIDRLDAKIAELDALALDYGRIAAQCATHGYRDLAAFANRLSTETRVVAERLRRTTREGQGGSQ